MFHSVVPMKADHIFLQTGHLPFQGSTRYFMAAGNKDSIKLAMGYSAWATQKKDLKVIREGLRQCGNTALIFRDEAFFYGLAKIVTDCDPSLHPKLFAHNQGLGPNFRLKWIKMCKMDAELTNSFRNPFDGMARVRLSKDAQEVETGIAEKLCEIMMKQVDYHGFDYSKKKIKKSEEIFDKINLKKQKTNKE